MKKEKTTPKLPLISKITLLGLSLIVGGAVLTFLLFSYHPADLLTQYINGDANVYVFALLMALLPLAGMPISIFLVLVGMLYGIPGGIALTGALEAFHLVMTYYLVHSFVRPLLIRLLGKFNMAIPKLPIHGRKRIGFVFMILPGLPYAVKNYLLALAKMPFRPYMAIGWTAQFGLSVSFIILGKGVIQMDPIILSLAVGLILLGAGLQYFLRRHYQNLKNSL